MGKNPIHIKPNHRGMLKRDLHIAAHSHIPLSKLMAAEHSLNPAVRKRAVFAANARNFKH